ncbi:MAG: threonine synthase [Desulfobacterales bacterium]|uniref:Threonine synthase n=1 Tax=Candidatus Desulfatibia profunda TaxID=2841695 RepID=A0A8J6NXZ4_9BACT|nr:threonine synthase [Candidatus Desulfatibia profunda]MBL7179500.1 threonine synthase [Desulfobacterales bacterium]
MKPENFPENIRPYIIPDHSSALMYRCLGCDRTYGIEKLLYTCPDCGQLLLIYDLNFDRLKQIPGKIWQQIFDYRKMLTIPALKGIYLYHEFIGPVIPLDAVVYLGEGHTPVVEANAFMQEKAGVRFYFKNDGQNPSASFKDRGMASALSYLNFLVREHRVSDVLAICASTGDTSASAALYASFLQPRVKSAVLLPHKKVTPQQLSQPLGSGAAVFEIPGVFDDCMKVVEALSENYHVALLNSKNAWRILGQESYSFEIAQAFEYDLQNIVVVVPIGNAGNITAVMSGFLKFYETGVIQTLPKILGVQSEHANPVYRYYLEPDTDKRKFVPVIVKPSVAQAAMIGNPVSMPRVIHLVDIYNRMSGKQNVFFAQVTEQAIMDWELLANRNGHIACTHGGESLAGLVAARAQGIVEKNDIAVIDSTAHALKFSGFQEMYFQNSFPSEFNISPNPDYINAPVFIHPKDLEKVPAPGKPLKGDDFKQFVKRVSEEIARELNLNKVKKA